MIERWDSGAAPQWGPGMVGRWTDVQLKQRDQWAGIGDREVVDAAMHTIDVRPRNASTETVVSQLMPIELQWLAVPGDEGRVAPAGGRYC